MDQHHNKLVFVIDGEVVQILGCDDRLAAVLLSSPTVLDVTERVDSGFNINNFMGMKYDQESGSFYLPPVTPSAE